MNRSIVFACIGALALSACGGGHGSSALPPASPATSATKAPPKSGNTSATLSVTVPHPSSTSTARRPAYVSPSSAQLVVAVNGGTATTYGLSATSPGCVTAEGNLQCTFQVAAAAGNDSFSLKLEDAAGAVLSQNVVGATLAAGAVTPVNVTLAGIPASAVIVPGTNSGIEDTATPAYHVPGLLPEPVELEALDADGNVIIGPGAPTFAAPTMSAGGSYASIVSAGTSDPNAYLLEASGPAGGQTVTVSATAQSIALNDGTQSPPVTGTTNFLFTPAIALASGPVLQEYSVEDGALVGQFALCSGGCVTSIANGIATDANGDIWVAYSTFLGLSEGHVVEEFKAATTAPTNVLSDTAGTMGIAIGTNGMLYNVNANSYTSGFPRRLVPGNITEYAAGTTAPEYTITDSTDLTMPSGIGVDGHGNVYVANSAGSGDVGPGNVVIWGPGSSDTPIATLSDPNLVEPGAIAVDPAGDVYVYDAQNEDVAYFAASGTTPTTQTSMTQALYGGPFTTVGALAFDPAGDLLIDGNGAFQIMTGSTILNSQTVTLTLAGNGYGAWIP